MGPVGGGAHLPVTWCQSHKRLPSFERTKTTAGRERLRFKLLETIPTILTPMCAYTSCWGMEILSPANSPPRFVVSDRRAEPIHN
jgi:hypothetical protein